MSIRLRLSLLYSAILAVTLVTISVVLYTTQSRYTLEWLKQDLVISSETLSQSIMKNYIDLGPGSGNGQNPNPPVPGERDPNAPAPGAPNNNTEPPPVPSSALSLTKDQTVQQQAQQEIVRVLDPDGKLIGSPFGSTDITLPLQEAGLQAVRKQQAWWATETVSSTRMLIYTSPMIFRNRVVGILQVSRALTERDQSLESLRNALIVANLLATVSAFGFGWLLARTALSPIQRISKTAQDIGSERNFTRRVAYQGPQDEVGQLALTFNTMLAQLEGAYQKVAQALEMQRRFVADVSHELRTPLTTLRGNLSLLGRKPGLPEADRDDILNDMVEETERLIRLVNELLALARSDAAANDAGRSLVKESIRLSPLLEETVRQAGRLAPGRDIHLDVAPELDITADRDALKQVLLILVDNAVKHTQGTITLAAAVSEEQVLISVCDEGPGIPPDPLAHVFERFYRGDGPRHTPGAGLGLPIAKALVEGQGGTITIQSDVNKGSTVLVTLPI
jgi:signal transduction histidine kinase